MYQNKDYEFIVPKAFRLAKYEYTIDRLNRSIDPLHISNKIEVDDNEKKVERIVRYKNFLPYDVYMIERSGVVTLLKSRRHASYSGVVVEKNIIQVRDSTLDIRDIPNTSIRDNERLTIKKALHNYTNFAKTDFEKRAEERIGNRYKKTTHPSLYNFEIIGHIPEELLPNDEKYLYCTEFDIILALDKETAFGIDVNKILHPYSQDVKNFKNRLDHINGYEVLEKSDRYQMSFNYICNDDSIKALWLPMGKDAVKIHVTKNISYPDGLQTFIEEDDKDGKKITIAKTYTLEEAKKHFGLAESYNDAINFMEQERMRNDRQIREDQLALEREKLDANRASNEAQKEIERLKRESIQVKITHETEMDKRTREVNEMKLTYEKEKQERAIKSDKANNSISLVKEIVGFCVAIIGIAAIIMKAKRK